MLSRRNSCGAKIQAMAVSTSSADMNAPIAVPRIRLAASISCRPKAWPIKTVDAIASPNTKVTSRNINMFPFAVAVRAFSPRKRPTHTALIEPFSDCRIVVPNIGKVKTIIVRRIGPCVKSCCPRLAAGAESAALFIA